MRRNWKKSDSKKRKKSGATHRSPTLTEPKQKSDHDAGKKFDELIRKKKEDFAKETEKEKKSLRRQLKDLGGQLADLENEGGRHTIRQKRMLEESIGMAEKRLGKIEDGTTAVEFDTKIAAFERERRRIEERAPTRRRKASANKKPRRSAKSDSSNRRRSAGHNRNIKVSTAEEEYDGGLDVLTQEMQDAFGDETISEEERAVFVSLRNVCPRCNLLMQKISSESVMACPQCGVMCPYVDGTAAATSHTDERSFSSFAYSRAGHFQSWLRTIQAKESATIPQEILSGVCLELAKKRVREEDVTPARVREALKEMRQRKYYENSVLICSLLTGKKPMRFSPEVEKTLENLFLKIQEPFRLAREALQPQRKNFLSYPYVAWKLLELLDAESVDKRWLSRFPKLKGRDKLAKSDVLWRHICAQLGWRFKPSA